MGTTREYMEKLAFNGFDSMALGTADRAAAPQHWPSGAPMPSSVKNGPWSGGTAATQGIPMSEAASNWGIGGNAITPGQLQAAAAQGYGRFRPIAAAEPGAGSAAAASVPAANRLLQGMNHSAPDASFPISREQAKALVDAGNYEGNTPTVPTWHSAAANVAAAAMPRTSAQRVADAPAAAAPAMASMMPSLGPLRVPLAATPGMPAAPAAAAGTAVAHAGGVMQRPPTAAPPAGADPAAAPVARPHRQAAHYTPDSRLQAAHTISQAMAETSPVAPPAAAPAQVAAPTPAPVAPAPAAPQAGMSGLSNRFGAIPTRMLTDAGRARAAAAQAAAAPAPAAPAPAPAPVAAPAPAPVASPALQRPPLARPA